MRAGRRVSLLHVHRYGRTRRGKLLFAQGSAEPQSPGHAGPGGARRLMMTRIGNVLAVFALLALVACVSTRPLSSRERAPDNLLENGSFEDGARHWSAMPGDARSYAIRDG